MAKQAHQQAPAPVDDSDLVTKIYGAANYAPAQALAAAGGDYLFAYLGTTMTSVSVPQRVLIDTVSSSRGDLALDTTTNVGRVSGLKAGRTYQLTGNLRCDGSGGYWSFYWYNVTAAEQLSRPGQAIAMNSGTTASAGPISAHIFTPTEDTEVELRIYDVDDPNDDVTSGRTWIQIIEIGAVQANVIGGLEFLDTINVTSDQTSVTLGAGGDGVLGTAIDSETDECYVCEFYLPSAGAAVNFTVEPDGVTSNQESAESYQGTSGGGSEMAGLAFAKQANTTRICGGTFEFHAKKGKHRILHSTGYVHDTSSTDRWIHEFSGHWADTTTEFTTLDLVSSVANGIKSGARFVLYRRTTQNLRADAANSFERPVESAVDVGSGTTEQTTGHTAYAGYVVGLTARIEEAVTAGTVTVNLKVDGTVTLSVELNTTYPTSRRGTANIGVHRFGPDKNVSVEIVAASYDNASSITSGITVVATLVNSALINVPDSMGVESQLWVPPESPHAYDDEFDSTTLDSAWTLSEAASSSAIDPYASFTTGGPRIALHTDRRKSWMMVQAENGTTTWISRAATVPTNFFVWARCSFITPIAIANNQAIVGIGFSATDTGQPDLNNRAQVYIDQDASANYAKFYVLEGGTPTTVGTLTDVDAQGQAITLLAIQKIGSVVHGWAGTEVGSWIYMGSETYTGTAFDRAFITIQSDLTTPGNSIQGVDFIRFVESATFLP